MLNSRLAVIGCLILAAGLLRVLPHPPNFAPVAAMALFAGAYVANVRLALLIPITTMLLSDLIIGFHAGLPLVYVCLAMTVFIGAELKGRLRLIPIGVAALASAILFFVVTNLGVWLTSGMYPLTVGGLSACFIAAIPFFQNTLLGDAFYVTLLFGGFAALERAMPRFLGTSPAPA